MVDVKFMRHDGKGGLEEYEPGPDDFDEVSGTLMELVTITKAQLRKLLGNAIAPAMPAPHSAELCVLCEEYDGHTPDCELPALEEMCK